MIIRPWFSGKFFYRVLIVGVGLVILASVVAGCLGLVILDYVFHSGSLSAEKKVTIPDGATGADVATILRNEKLIEHELFFRLALRISPDSRPIRRGTYRLRQGMSPMRILEILRAGPEQEGVEPAFRITIPEGLSLTQMAALTPDPEGFLAAARDPELIQLLGLPVSSLEGFLMPETYFFDAPPTGRELVERMLKQFQKNWDNLAKDLPYLAGMDKLRLVTVASIIEEESRVPEERPMVARVIYNRLEKGMPLQMDSTLQYALNKYGERMLDADKQVQSPYNTYLNKGLPPGPISSPGLSSIRAAIQPAEGRWIYFVSNADGKTHTFSATEAEHLEAVARYRREIAEQRRQLNQAAGKTNGT
ncbi:MAG TPA: endolytic transglycosylase MltG [Candidatus Hydrogenedentes bacterium]|nr:endolytic transglycosylase MltG [Candidatus Hydrogenedentota bacterium]HOK89818.1 endolytic transglycosylase MltG [Candidatus Hydrogenedentota bacterium]